MVTGAFHANGTWMENPKLPPMKKWRCNGLLLFATFWSAGPGAKVVETQNLHILDCLFLAEIWRQHIFQALKLLVFVHRCHFSWKIWKNLKGLPIWICLSVQTALSAWDILHLSGAHSSLETDLPRRGLWWWWWWRWWWWWWYTCKFEESNYADDDLRGRQATYSKTDFKNTGWRSKKRFFASSCHNFERFKSVIVPLGCDRLANCYVALISELCVWSKYHHHSRHIWLCQMTVGTVSSS